MNVLVVGYKGQLGQELANQRVRDPIQIILADIEDLDITRPNQVYTFINETHPHLIINAAAYTQVDLAEDEPESAFRVNKNGPENLAKACSERGIPLIHISTDYVFNGKKGSAYSEDDPTSPTGIYGRSKAAGEQSVRSCLSSNIIIRTSWLYSVFGHNFVKTMLRLGKSQKIIRVVSDQFGSPTSAADLAEAVLSIARRIEERREVKWGTYHYCGKGIISWHQFAEKIFSVARQYDPAITPVVESIKSEDYPTSAKRPPFSALSCERIQKNFDIHPKPWQKSLKNTIKRIFLKK